MRSVMPRSTGIPAAKPDDSECRETLGGKIPKAGNIAGITYREMPHPVYHQNTDVIYYDEAVKG